MCYNTFINKRAGMSIVNQLFIQFASDDDKRYAKAYHALKELFDSFSELTSEQQYKLLNQFSVEVFIRKYQELQ